MIHCGFNIEEKGIDVEISYKSDGLLHG